MVSTNNDNYLYAPKNKNLGKAGAVVGLKYSF